MGVTDIPPGKSIRFFASLPVPPLMESLIPSCSLLFWFSYNRDGTIYSGASGDVVENHHVIRGVEQSRRETRIDKNAKLSLHGSGTVLGPDRATTKAHHLGYSILGLKQPRSLVKHFISSPSNYVTPFNIRSFDRKTDIHLKDVFFEPKTVAIEFVVQPENHRDEISPYRWRTKPLDDGSRIIIAARKFNVDMPKPEGHLMRVDVTDI